jgi:hypothetical protein
LDGKPIAVYLNYALHLDTVGGEQYSADYPHILSTRSIQLPLAEVKPEEIAPARAIASTFGKPDAAPFNELVKAARINALSTLAPMDVVERRGKLIEAEVQVVSFGPDLAWLALPGEIFMELGLAIKQGSPFPLSDLKAHAQGAYGVMSGRWAPWVRRNAGGHGNQAADRTSKEPLTKLTVPTWERDKLEGWERIDTARTPLAQELKAHYLKAICSEGSARPILTNNMGGWRDQNRHGVAVLVMYPIDSTFENRHSVAVLILGSESGRRNAGSQCLHCGGLDGS